MGFFKLYLGVWKSPLVHLDHSRLGFSDTCRKIGKVLRVCAPDAAGCVGCREVSCANGRKKEEGEEEVKCFS